MLIDLDTLPEPQSVTMEVVESLVEDFKKGYHHLSLKKYNKTGKTSTLIE